MTAREEGPDPLPESAGMAARVASVDWSATPLGPAENWPQSLQTALSICLSSRFPLLVWWGPQLTGFYNDAYLPLLGTKHPRALGQRASDTWAEAWDELGPMAERVLAGGDATFSEDRLLFLQRHGYVEETYWTFSYSPIQDESGGVGGIFVAVSDTTKRVIGERRLRILRELGELSGASAGTAAEACRSAVDVLHRHRGSVPFALAYVRDGGDVLRLAGSSGIRPGSEAAPVTLPADSLWLADTGETVAGATIEGLRDRWTDWYEPGPLGDAVPDRALAFPLVQAGEQEPIGLIVLGVNPYRELDQQYRSFFDLAAGHVATAVTDALAYQAERRRAEALAELDRAKTDFFSNVSHEFRTPLTLIMGPLAELRSAPEVERNGRLREELDVIARNADRLGKLVNTLLDFSRLQSGRIDARFEPVDLAGFTAELASVFRSAVARAGLEFAVDCPPLPQSVHVDRDMWEKVVLNLLSNAVKYTFEGGITVRLHPDDDGAVLTIADTGTGIPAEELPRLFERFHRVPHARARSGEGSGIGLAMVRELVALHGGTITADSAPGRGTT
ncbi:MAG: ATP-binding protein, partial [Kineosporiaceae bacterium]